MLSNKAILPFHITSSMVDCDFHGKRDRRIRSFCCQDQIMVPYSVLVDLQRRVLKTEALLDKKKEENATLKLQIKQLERKRQQYETKMKLMEKTWQDQLTSMQVSFRLSLSLSLSLYIYIYIYISECVCGNHPFQITYGCP